MLAPVLLSCDWRVALRTRAVVDLLVSISPVRELIVASQMEFLTELAEVDILLFSCLRALTLVLVAHVEGVLCFFFLLVADLPSGTSSVLFALADVLWIAELRSSFETLLTDLSFASWNDFVLEALLAADSVRDWVSVSVIMFKRELAY